MDDQLKSAKSPMNYRDAGVDISAGNALVERIKPLVKLTHRPEVVTELGGFAGLFKLDMARYQQPLLVSATDGVGTKVKLAANWGKHDGIGIDLVAMCVNDLLCCGAEPLFFLDYYATGQLSVDTATAVIASIAEGCQQAGAALIGGETAEMPSVYAKQDYDLAGFCVGIVEQSKLIDGKAVQPGDALIGIASSGPHANGFSLIRKVLERAQADADTIVDGKPLHDWLLTPTKIYVKALQQLLQAVPVHALAHITGGGITENLPRVLPNHSKAVIDVNSWQQPAIFSWLQQQGSIEESEMWRTFNRGVGMIVCVPEDVCQQAIDILNAADETAWQIGHIAQHKSEPVVEFVND